MASNTLDFTHSSISFPALFQMTVDQDPLDYANYNSFVELFEAQAARYHDRIFIRYQPLEEELEFKPITFSQFDRIGNYLAREWAPLIGDAECVGFLGDEPVQTLMAMLAVFKLRRIFFSISTRIPPAAITDLLIKTNTQYVIASEECSQVAQGTAKDLPTVQVKTWESFDVDQLIDLSENCSAGINTDDPKDALEETILVLHSSGSTGPPKPMYQSNQWLMQLIPILMVQIKHTCPELSLDADDIILSTVPMFHGSGVMMHWMVLLFGAHTLAFRRLPVSAQDILSATEKYCATIVLASPVPLKILAEYIQDEGISETTAEALRRVKFCMCGGEQLVREAGDFLHSKGLNVRSVYGITEANFLGMSNIAKDNKYWYSLEPIKMISSYYNWEPFDDGVYHLTIRSDCPGLYHNITIRPDGYYETLDLLREEPPNSGYYRHLGRISDTFLMRDGKRAYPTLMENEIRNASIVKQCTVIGENRERTATLIELNEKRSAKYTPEEIIAQVYEAVRVANKEVLEHSAITVPELVYILPLGKTLPTIPKGPVSRKDALREFKEEISKLYSDFLGKSA
ncbi:hypothetical protein BJV82DRAFT_599005 [Fennellomyces sp. T-0311]|nr:hypothetical protein BJV82DRAFT_599005 [Fennellomyces sp. T-0311]